MTEQVPEEQVPEDTELSEEEKQDPYEGPFAGVQDDEVSDEEGDEE